MDIKEFSDRFDTLLNSFGVTPNIVLDEYEKSVFLTNAQEEVIVDIYNGNTISGHSFEETEEARRCLSELIVTYKTNEKLTNYNGISKNSKFFKIPEDVWFITYESVTLQGEGCLNGKEALVVPTTQDEFYKVQKNPFRGPSETRVLRLDNANNIVELVSKYDLDRYLLRYIVKPSPIILTNLHDGLSINGISIETECKLNPIIHRIILERAVRLAIQSRISNIGKE
jgi:hypothetical protein